MSSIIKVNTIQDTDGNNIINENANTITIGKSGDTVTVASGATFVGGGIEWQSSIVTGTTLSAVAGKGYWINTTSNACTVTLPASASVGDQIIFTDYARTWDTNNLTINTNSLNYQGNTSPNPVYDTAGESVHIVYSGATNGWIPVDDGAVSYETPQSYSIDFLVIGGGASGGTYTPATGYSNGNSGSSSSISGTGLTTITSAGGGYGGAYNSNVGGDGGSGGGGGGSSTGASVAGGSGNTPSTSPSQGNNGGLGGKADGNEAGGGGGGAGAYGSNAASPYTAGSGGDGTASSITGSSVTRAGGGGGCIYLSGTDGAGGAGGGTAGNKSAPASNAAANTGSGGGAGDTGSGAGHGGGGAGGYRTSTQTVNPLVTITVTVGDGGASVGYSGAGGKGVVILSMPDANYSGTTTGSPTVATGVSGKTVLTFTGSGSYTT